MNDNTEQQEWHRLFNAALNHTITDSENAELASLLKTSAEARQLWFLYHDNECGLAELKQWRRAPELPAKVGAASARATWLSWRPLAAAAAGLCVGLFSASMVWGYVGRPSAGTPVTLLQEGFESGPDPMVTGVPLEAGRWSGDYTEIVGEHLGVTPASGKKMLRFLRADYEGKPAGDGYIADLFRIIDLRGSELEVGRGDACVSVEALFRALDKKGLNRIRCSITIYALDELPEEDQRHEFFLKPREESSAAASETQDSGATILATATRQEIFKEAGTRWETARNELRVPPGTRYLVVHLHEWLLDSKGPREPQPVQFAGLFLDDVRVTLTHLPPLP